MNSELHTLLVEIGTEELPPGALADLSHSFAEGVAARFAEQGIGFQDIEPFATPRRLALLVQGMAERQPDRESVRRGPSLSSAFGPEGSPSKAALGFARSCGVPVEALSREVGDKGEWLCHRSVIPGAATADLVADLVEGALAGLPIPKRMRWGAGEEQFVRPVHWVCVVLGDRPVTGRVLGVECGNCTRGHRFHHPDPIVVGHAEQYPDLLRRVGWVEPSLERRRQRIGDEVDRLARALGVRPEIDPALLDEVTALVEWPSALMGSFDEGFLEMPPEVLIETMQKNQRYFPVRDAKGRLQARFVAVANIESRDPAQVVAGNERVIRPRFADAWFFWKQDLAQPLGNLFARLEGVVFQERLGSLADKARRIARLGVRLAEATGADPSLTDRAAHLAKCDLVSSMVFELPALQGTMGRYYAERSGEHPEVCAAMEEQYLPRFAGDRLPRTTSGRLVGLADRLDTLVGVFGIGHRPTGAKDPYGARRASVGILRVLIETPLEIDLKWALECTERGFPEGIVAAGTASAVLEYVFERLGGYYQERDIDSDIVAAVLATGETFPSRIDGRARAVKAFLGLPEAEALLGATKRIRNILAKTVGEAADGSVAPNAALLQDAAERDLWERVRALEAETAPFLEKRDYGGVLGRLAVVRDDVDRFFESVLVMTEDATVRGNRIALLARLLSLFLRVADISKLQRG